MLVFLGLVATVSLVIVDRRNTLTREQQLAEASLYRVRASLEQSLAKRLTLVMLLEALIKSDPNLNLDDPRSDAQFRQRFANFTTSIEQHVPGILSLQLSPNGIVTYLTNPERNAKAIGHNLFTLEKDRLPALAAIHQKEMVVAGPLDLRQGGNAIIARLPIFTQPGTFNRQPFLKPPYPSPNPWVHTIPSDFWGFATVLVDTEVLYREAGLNQLPDNYRFALRGKNGQGWEGEVFWGDPTVFDQPLTTVEIWLPSGEWIMGVQLRSPPGYGRSLLLFCLGTAATAIVTYGLILDQQAKLTAESANQLKSEFLALVSHELRTPLNSVLGLAHLLAQSHLTAQQKTYLHTIQSSAQVLLHIINDILDLSKVEAGKLELESIPFDLRQVVKMTADLLKVRAEEKGITLKIEIHEKIPPALIGDPLRLGQVLLNLLGNGIKFTDRGTVQLQIELVDRQADRLPDRLTYPAAHQAPDPVTDRLTDRVLLRFAVRDTGIGMSPQQTQRLFQMFSQVSASGHRKYGGTGLGLVICQRLVELMGSKIHVTSQVEQGSCFTFELWLGYAPAIALEPLTTDSATPPANLTATPTATHWRLALQQQVMTRFSPFEPAIDSPIHRPSPAQLQAIGGAQILLIEDDPVNQIVTTNLLTQEGLRVDLAANGKAALQQVRKQTYDLILTDLQMPDMSGFEVTQQLRQLGRDAGGNYHWLRSVPILALTAQGSEIDQERCFAMGMNDHLAKPIQPTVLLNALVNWLPIAQTDPGRSRSIISPAPPEVSIFPKSKQPSTETSSPPIAPSRAQIAATTSLNLEHIPHPGHHPGHHVIAPRHLPPRDRLNLSHGVTAVDGDYLAYYELLQVFSQTYQPFVMRLRSALEQDHWSEIAKLAHTLKGAAANIAAERVTQQATEFLEIQERYQNPDPVSLSTKGLVLMDELEQLLQHIQTILDDQY